MPRDYCVARWKYCNLMFSAQVLEKCDEKDTLNNLRKKSHWILFVVLGTAPTVLSIPSKYSHTKTRRYVTCLAPGQFLNANNVDSSSLLKEQFWKLNSRGSCFRGVGFHYPTTLKGTAQVQTVPEMKILKGTIKNRHICYVSQNLEDGSFPLIWCSLTVCNELIPTADSMCH